MTPFEMIFWPLWFGSVWMCRSDRRMIEWQYRMACWFEEKLREVEAAGSR